MSDLKRINKIGFVKGSIWGTVPAFAVDDGLLVQSISGFNNKRNVTPDHGAGLGFPHASHVGAFQAVEPSFQALLYEACNKALLIVAMMFGKDTVVGVADPYVHTLEAEEESNFFLGAGLDEGSEVRLLNSAIVEEVSISPDGKGRLVVDFKLKGDKVVTGAGTELDSLTYKEINGVFTFNNVTFRINAQSGAALAVGDELEISDFKLTMKRGSDSVIPAGNSNIIQPKQGAFPEFTFEFTVPRKPALAKTLQDAFEAGTLMKVDLVFVGSSADREITFEFPQVRLSSADIDPGDVLSQKVSASLEKAAAAPTGMTMSLYPACAWKTDVVTSPLA